MGSCAQREWFEPQELDPDGDYKFCCLGVLENLYHLEKGSEFKEARWSDGGHTKEVADWSGLSAEYDATDDNKVCTGEKDCFGDTLYMSPAEYLAHMNDKNKSFKQIARWIERNL
jgi:hypothetical protein